MNSISSNTPIDNNFISEKTEKKKETLVSTEENTILQRQAKAVSKHQTAYIPKHQVSAANTITCETQNKIVCKTQEMLQQVQKNPSTRMKQNQKLEADPKFVCDDDTFQKLVPEFESQLHKNANFDTSVFLSGVKEFPAETVELNQRVLDDSVNFVGDQAKKLSLEKSISLEDAYKMVIGILDKYDDVAILQRQLDNSFTPQSTFTLRSAVLLASQKDGIGLQSWMVYTKSGKSDTKDMWTFLDNWKNWVPEAQGAMAKFSEVTFVKAKELAINNSQNQLVLLKGGFGAGKTRLAGQLMKENASGVVAPDLGKRVVRRAMNEVPHSSAHVQGSQIAYKLFDELIQRQIGTVVYDSSLSSARDVSGYLNKSKEAGKKMVIYDVARHDMARSLAVLKREVDGDDPRIPPDFIIRSAINDKLNRVECMKVILNDTVKPGQENFAPEYRFIGADAKGWNAEEVMILTPHKVEEKHPEMLNRLGLEGIKVDTQNNTVSLTLSKQQLEDYFTKQFELPAKDIMKGLSNEENQSFLKVFSKRVLISNLAEHSIHNVSSLYEALPENIKKFLSKTAFEQSFESIKKETLDQFFESIKELPQLQSKIQETEKLLENLKNSANQSEITIQENLLKELKNQYEERNSISYLNLPFKTALIIHHNLQGDPWL